MRKRRRRPDLEDPRVQFWFLLAPMYLIVFYVVDFYFRGTATLH